MSHVVTPNILFGDADGSEGFYTPVSTYVTLNSFRRLGRRTTSRVIPKYKKAWAKVQATSSGNVTGIEIILGAKLQYMGLMQTLVSQIEQYVGGSSSGQPKDLWYIDDVYEYIISTNIEYAAGAVTVEYSGDDAFISEGDYLYYPSGDTALPHEVVVVDSIDTGANTFVADLQNGHLATQALFKINWVYPKARLESVNPAVTSTGRGHITMALTSEGAPLNGTSLPS